MGNAFAYCRVSGTGQLDGHGLERQEDAARRFARSRDVRIVEVFQDSHTGTEADRPGFTAMLAALRANGTKGLSANKYQFRIHGAPSPADS